MDSGDVGAGRRLADNTLTGNGLSRDHRDSPVRLGFPVLRAFVSLHALHLPPDPMTDVRGIRGAVQASANSREAIHGATRTLLLALIEANRITADQIASAFLTSTVDLNADFPAYAVRQLEGWDRVPLLGAQEMDVPGAMPRVIRILLHVNSDRPQAGVRHVYLGATAKLRPDLESP